MKPFLPSWTYAGLPFLPNFITGARYKDSNLLPISNKTKSNMITAQQIHAINTQIYAHAEKLGIKNLEKQGLSGLSLCQIYTIAKPLLIGLESYETNLLWKMIIGAVQAELDSLCPTT